MSPLEPAPPDVGPEPEESEPVIVEVPLTSSPPQLPVSIGRYEIVRELGRGAMGRVYLARDPVIGRLVALKTFHLGHGADPDEREILRRRLVREANSAGRVSHPNVVTIYDVLEDADTLYVAMEYVEGTSLEERLALGTAVDVASVVDQTAAALDHLHAHGVVHRDIKPANLLLTAEGTVKLTDFGIALASDPAQTQETALFGTPQYLAPELLRGQPASPRADVFALGVLTYEMLTRHNPFPGSTVAEVTSQILTGSYVPPSRWVEGLSPDVTAVVERALARDPERRFASAGALAAALRRAIEGSGSDQGTMRIGGGRRRAVPARPGAALLLAVLAVVAAAIGFWRIEGSESATAAPVAGRTELDRAYLRLLAEGSRLLREGDPEAAAVVFGTAERMAPSAPAAARLRRHAQQKVEESAIADRVAVARAALATGRYEEAIATARELLQTDAGRQAALEVLAGVEESLARAELRRREERAAPVPRPIAAPRPPAAIAETRAPAPAAEDPPVADARLDVRLFSAVPKGVLAIYAGDRRIVYEPFAFTSGRDWLGRGKPSAGQLRRSVELTPGTYPLRVMLTREREAAQLVTVDLFLAAGAQKELEVLLPEVGVPRAALRTSLE